MQVNVRLFATLREGRGKTLTIELKESAVVRDVLAVLAIAEQDAAILLRNRLDVTLDSELAPQDTISIFPPVGGG
ncbi:MAG: MoaD/ThiS family protein [Firmicutes bacterium]|nr:MoaD/ThiS family protein [Bacillota bacterium]